MPNPKPWIAKVIADKPWTVESAIPIFEELLEPTFTVFEWGAGGSTLWLAQRVQHVFSVESDPDWYDQLVGKAEALNLWEKVTIYQVAADDLMYVNSIHFTGSMQNFDMIFIDGKSGTRRLCAEAALQHIASGGWIVLDNSEADEGAAAILESAGWVADKHSGPVYDPRRDRKDWGHTEIAFWHKKTEPAPGGIAWLRTRLSISYWMKLARCRSSKRRPSMASTNTLELCETPRAGST